MNRLEVTTPVDRKAIVAAFTSEHATDIEHAITKVEVNVKPDTNVTHVVDVLLPKLLSFGRQHADFLDKELSPYAGL